MHVGKKALHFALLLFTAFWLVATSAPRKPARDCFVPLKGDKLSVTLGAPQPPAGSTSAPSCQGIDGLGDGSVLRVRLSRAGKRPDVRQGACWGYDVELLSGPRGLTTFRAIRSDGTELFETAAQFSAEECAGEYEISLAYDGPIAQGKLVDAMHPAKADRWLVRRRIYFQPDSRCAKLPTLPHDVCGDAFEVKGVTDAP